MASEDSLYLGIHGHVVRVRKHDGAELWRTRLKGSGLANVVVEPDGVYASTNGRLFALDPATGEIRWSNDLPRLGYGHCIIASANQMTVVAAAQQAATAQSGAAPGAGIH